MTEPVLFDLSSKRQLYDLEFHVEAVKNGSGLDVIKIEEIFEQLDVDKLKQAYGFIFRRHDQLRSTFRRIDSEFKQAFHEYTPERYKMLIYDLSDVDIDTQEIEWTAIKKEVNDSFNDLDKELPLAQGILVRTSESGYTFTLYCHHLISDGFSLVLFAKELVAVYNDLINHKEVNLPAIETSCREFLLQRNIQESGGYGDKFYAYWEKKINAYLTPIDQSMLYDKFYFPNTPLIPNSEQLKEIKRNIHQVVNWSSYTVPFENKAALLKISKERGVTPNIILTACFFFTAHICYSTNKVMAASTISGRTTRASQLIIGNLFGNIFVMSEADPKAKVGDLMWNIYMDFIQSYRYPVFDYDNFPSTGTTIREDFEFFINFLDIYANKDIALTNHDNYKHRVDNEYYALSYIVREYKNGFTFTWTYQNDLYNEKVIESMADVHLFIVNEFISNPEATFASLSRRVRRSKFRRKTGGELLQGCWRFLKGM